MIASLVLRAERTQDAGHPILVTARGLPAGPDAISQLEAGADVGDERAQVRPGLREPVLDGVEPGPFGKPLLVEDAAPLARREDPPRPAQRADVRRVETAPVIQPEVPVRTRRRAYRPRPPEGDRHHPRYRGQPFGEIFHRTSIEQRPFSEHAIIRPDPEPRLAHQRRDRRDRRPRRWPMTPDTPALTSGWSDTQPTR